jgi:hypothetical protein
MRAPHRSRCRSAHLLAIVTVLLMSSAAAQAAGDRDDEGFIQAVIEGRRNSREAYERALKQERQAADEARRSREREASIRGSGAIPDQPPGGDGTGSEVAPEGTDTGDGGESESPFPWTLVMLAGLALLVFFALRPRFRGRSS